jgi:RNA polymerase sigma factor (sigma-70 family)
MTELEPIVLVVDDDASMRRGLEKLLRSVGLDVATFASAAELMRRPPPEGPSCLILDLRLPGMSGLELQQQLEATSHRPPIIFLTGHATVPVSVRALKDGALDFLQKPVEEQILLDAVHRALARDRQTRAREAELQRLQRQADSLTPREREVFGLVVTGLSNKEIAATLGTSEKTVKIQRGRVMQKMHASSLVQLVRLADQLGYGVSPSAST